jgi:uncharacterized protein YllA (UPF0747 family)
MMFGCFRKGDANDPDMYVAAITSTLARYPEDVIIEVTHPGTGLPTKSSFLPSVKEVFDYCEKRMEPRREAAARQKRIDKQLADRAEYESRGKKLSDHISKGFSPSTQGEI